LDEFEAKATFFCIGDNIRKHPTVFDLLKRSHHALGNHTFNHLKAWKTSDERYLQNTLQCEEYLSGYPEKEGNKLFRPPYGQINKKKIKLLSSYKIVMWDVLTQDYNSSISPELCLRGSIQATRPGSIVVFHDSYKAERNMMYALPRFLEHFKNRGYSFQKITTE
jgi:peptidoglycan/xylan/chitin deacetylase (PgdA/CDA1 family)